MVWTCLMRNRETDIAYFLSFCVEHYKQAKGLSGAEAAQTLGRYGVLDYLSRHYDVLHTQGHRWLLEEIDELIQRRKGEDHEVVSR